MATIDNIITLIEKGYSKEEIDNLLAQDETDVPESSPEGAKDSQEEAKDSQKDASKEDTGETPPEESPADDPMQILSKQVLELTKQVQTMTAAAQLKNVKSAEQPDGGSNEMTPEEFLLRSVYPDYKKEEK